MVTFGRVGGYMYCEGAVEHVWVRLLPGDEFASGEISSRDKC